jgi:hypothetical protein
MDTIYMGYIQGGLFKWSDLKDGVQEQAITTESYFWAYCSI